MFINNKIIKKIYKDYYHKTISSKEISKKYNIKLTTVSYILGKVKMRQIDYLNRYYSKDFLEHIISQNTYKESSDILKLPFSTFRHLLNLKGIKKLKPWLINTIDPSFYNTPNNAFYYYLGLIASDGYIKKYNTIRITIKNKGAEKLFNKLKLITNYKGHVTKTTNNFFEITFVDEKLVEKIGTLGIPLKDKTRKLQMPIINTKEYLACYILGFLDGDGTFSKNSLTFSLGNFSKNFLEDLNNYIFMFFNIKGSIYGKNNFYHLYFKSRETKEIISFAYRTCPLFLECKQEIFAERLKLSNNKI